MEAGIGGEVCERLNPLPPAAATRHQILSSLHASALLLCNIITSPLYFLLVNEFTKTLWGAWGFLISFCPPLFILFFNLFCVNAAENVTHFWLYKIKLRILVAFYKHGNELY